MSSSIFAAMVKAQKEYGPALKRSNNPHFGKKYADLSACIEAVVDALNSNGICLTQVCHENADGAMVETILVHDSGESFSGGKLFVPAEKRDPQKFGSALTYARRYSLQATCGIAPEDDDGNAASANPAPKAATPPAPTVPERIAKCSTLDELATLWKSLTKQDQTLDNIMAKDARKVVLAQREAANGTH